MKKLFAIGLLLVATAALGETFHVTGILEVPPHPDKTHRNPPGRNLITGTIGNRRYILVQIAAFHYYHFEVGQDYKVENADDKKKLKLRVQDKMGREAIESLTIAAIEEAPAGNPAPQP